MAEAILTPWLLSRREGAEGALLIDFGSQYTVLGRALDEGREGRRKRGS
jgi:hypothetical protein